MVSQSFVGVQEKRDSNLRKMTTFVENSKYVERCQFEMINDRWVQVDRAMSYKQGHE